MYFHLIDDSGVQAEHVAETFDELERGVGHLACCTRSVGKCVGSASAVLLDSRDCLQHLLLQRALHN